VIEHVAASITAKLQGQCSNEVMAEQVAQAVDVNRV
jgi:hypothetical protein